MTPTEHNRVFFANGTQNRIMLEHYQHQYREACKWNARLLFALSVLVVANVGFVVGWFLVRAAEQGG